MLFRVDPSSPDPLFAQLADQVRVGIVRGDLTTGTRLPSARDLASSLDINLHTVLRAYQDLRDEGLIELRRGRGAVVSEQAARGYAPLQQAVEHVVHLSRELGLSPETTTALLREALR
ncbi:GntR family transcriptional regulator [Cellulomonas sp. P22]|uniref:GntR family transcriptional regulator n=1 Tax=Cellulomonas sp. P22 TaxID=3373189 RepID=UPI0037B58D1C